MKLKRVYDRSGKNPVFKHIKVLRTNKFQKFTQRIIDDAMEDGWMTISKGKLIVHAKPDDVVYNIIRKPGYYCCHDEQRISGGSAARKYISENYPEIPSPDPANPSGYRKDNFYFCELEGETV